MSKATIAVLLGFASLSGSIAYGADASAGRSTFRSQCTVCHSAEPNDGGGAQGPDLNGVFGRKAGSTSFAYTKALKDSNLTWDAATLDRFLAAPTKVVPGTNMVVAIPAKQDRDNLIAYFRSLSEHPVSQERPEAAKNAPQPAGASAGADWKNDVPGRTHRIDANALSAPFATESARNSPGFVQKPSNAKLQVPDGFAVNVFASDLQGPRRMRLAPNGDVFVSETSRGRVRVLRPAADGATAQKIETFADGMNQPFGIRFYPAKNPKWVYVAELNRVVRFPYQSGDLKARGKAEVVVPELAPDAAGGHTTRDIAFSPDGKRLFVSVGSRSNVAEEMSKKSPAQIKAWEAQHALGAAWDVETHRADVLAFDVNAPQSGKIFATGIRNCVGLTIQPQTGELWCTTNERDGLGDNLVPDYSTRVKEGGFYGWPWYYLGNHEDPRLKGDRPDLAGKAIVPDVLYQAHSAALTTE
ncbi:MAG TPA: PQQ-dependent sugar dehydrogenase, partial [Steroidobacteraceae bacterium]|nr:PQQ-dependent sugar dehydrogenase [Steroidobacteraceae bacterium]